MTAHDNAAYVNLREHVAEAAFVAYQYAITQNRNTWNLVAEAAIRVIREEIQEMPITTAALYGRAGYREALDTVVARLDAR